MKHHDNSLIGLHWEDETSPLDEFLNDMGFNKFTEKEQEQIMTGELDNEKSND